MEGTFFDAESFGGEASGLFGPNGKAVSSNMYASSSSPANKTAMARSSLGKSM